MGPKWCDAPLNTFCSNSALPEVIFPIEVSLVTGCDTIPPEWVLEARNLYIVQAFSAWYDSCAGCRPCSVRHPTSPFNAGPCARKSDWRQAEKPGLIPLPPNIWPYKLSFNATASEAETIISSC